MMDTTLTARFASVRSSFGEHVWPVVWPAALGFCAAGLLGASGFGLGYLYSQIAGPAAPSVAMAATLEAPTTLAASPLAASNAPAVVEPVGGPEDPAPRAAVSPASLTPAGSAGKQPGIASPVVGGWISSHYGRRLDPFTGQPALHRGLDFAGLDNSAILAVAPGVVTWSGRRSGYGNLIEIDHGRGWVTRYGHNAFNLVRPGDYVKPGETIALMGATGRATGTHLHFEVLYRGRHQDPARFVPRDT